VSREVAGLLCRGFGHRNRALQVRVFADAGGFVGATRSEARCGLDLWQRGWDGNGSPDAGRTHVGSGRDDFHRRRGYTILETTTVRARIPASVTSGTSRVRRFDGTRSLSDFRERMTTYVISVVPE